MINEDEYTITDHKEGVTVGKVSHTSHKFPYLRDNEIVVKADGVNHLLDYVDKHMKDKQGESSGEGGPGYNFNSLESFEATVDVFRDNPESIVDFDPAEFRIKDESEAGSKVDYNVVGDYIDMGRYMEGIPETWGTMHNGNARNRRITLFIDTGNLARVTASDISHRGERILRLVDALEAGGVRTELIGIRSSSSAHIEITLKKHEEPLTITDLAVVLHSEWHRRIQFRIIENGPTFTGSSYGSSIDLTDAINRNPQVIRSNNNDEINIFIGGSMYRHTIDDRFDKLEKLLVWELSKPTPEVDAMKVDDRSISFSPNGYRAEADIKREGLEVIGAEE